jgi:hypothetical protein
MSISRKFWELHNITDPEKLAKTIEKAIKESDPFDEKERAMMARYDLFVRNYRIDPVNGAKVLLYFVKEENKIPHEDRIREIIHEEIIKLQKYFK